LVRLEARPPGSPVPVRRQRRFIVPAAFGAVVLIAVVVLIRASVDTDDSSSDKASDQASEKSSPRLPAPGQAQGPTKDRAKNGGDRRPPAPAPPPVAALPAVVSDLPPGPDMVIPSGVEPVADAGAPAAGPSGVSASGPHPAHPRTAGKEASRTDGTGGHGGGAVARDGAGGRRGDQKVAVAGDANRREAVWQRTSSEADPNSKLVARFSASGGATLKGRVVDAEDGKAAAGVAVEAHIGDSFMKTTSDAAGVFRMPGILPGRRITVWIIGRPDTVAERLDVTSPGEGETSDAGVVRLLSGDELASHLEGWMGMFVSRRGQRNVVAAVSPWSPADRAGIEVGDVLLSIAGRDVDGLGSRATGFLLRGPVGTKVGIAIQDRQGIVQKYQLERVLR